MHAKRHKQFYLLSAIAFILAFVALPTAHAANIWVGAAGDGNWNSGANWDTGVPAPAQLLTFSGNMQTITSNNIGSFTAASFLFTNDGTSGKTSSFTLGGPNGVTSSASFSINTTAVTGTAITDTISLNLTLNNNASINTGASHNLIASGAILNGTGLRTLSKTGVGELTLTSAGNTYGGATSFNQGILTVDVAGGIANQGVASALGRQTTAANAQLNFNGGTLNVKSGANSTDRQIRIGSDVPAANGGATIANNSANGSTPLVFTTAAFNNTTDTGMNAVTAGRTLTLGGANTDANSINGVIADHNTGGGGIVRVTKADTGRWILSGANTYTGATTISAGTLQLGDGTTGKDGTVASSSIVNNGSLVFNRFGSSSYGGVISGSGSVTKSGAGTQLLSGANNYSGSTTINAGTLIVDGSITSGSVVNGGLLNVNGTVGAVTVNTGGTLSGVGTIGTTTVAGTLTPGNSPGVLSVNGNLTMASGGNMVWELFTNTATQASPVAVFDQVLVSGDLAFAGNNGITLNFGTALDGSTVSWSDSFWNSNRSFLIYDVAGSTFGFSDLSLLNTSFNDATGAALADTRGSFSLSQAGSDVFLSYNAIPEPSTGTLLGFGLGGLVLTRLMRRKQS